MKPRIYRRHPLNMHLERAGIAGGSVSKIVIFRLVILHLLHAPYNTPIKTIGYVTDVIEISC